MLINMKNKFLTLLFALILAVAIAVPAFATQLVVTTEGSLDRNGLSVSADIANKYVGPADIKLTPLGDDAVLDEFNGLSAYKAADSIIEMAGFEAASETDFSGTITKISVKMKGDFSQYFMEKLVVIHKYGENFEAIPVSIINLTGNNEYTADFSTNYGLGQFVIAANPNSGASEASQLSSEAAAPGSPEYFPSSQKGPAATVLIIVIILLVAAATGVIISMAVKQNRKE